MFAILFSTLALAILVYWTLHNIIEMILMLCGLYMQEHAGGYKWTPLAQSLYTLFVK